MEPEQTLPPVRSEMGGRDLDQARALFEDTYNGAGFRTDATHGRFAYRYTTAGDTEMTLRSSMFLGDIRGAIQPEREYVVAWITAGEGRVDVGADEAAFELGRPLMFPTGKAFEFEVREYRQNLVHFDAAYLERIAAEHEGTLAGPLQFDHTAVPDLTNLRQWQATITNAAKTILGGESTELLRSELNRQSAVALLQTFTHRSIDLPPSLLVPRNARLREAVEYLHTHAHLPVNMTHVAETVHLTPRGLQQAFSRQLGVTPTEYLRTLRLDHVRAELIELAPGEATVGSVAQRWGFTHLSRFTASYVQRFGEYPSATLKG